MTNIRTDKAVYSRGETITVHFFNASPRSDDWIGVYPSQADENNLGAGFLWLWHCNRQGTTPCNFVVSVKT